MFKKAKEHKVILIGTILSFLIIGLGLLFNKDNSTYISDSYVSAAAFVMLIITAIMQNNDLKLQRDEMNATRKEQKTLNDLNIFFGLISLRDEKLKSIRSLGDGNCLSNAMERYVFSVYKTVYDEISENKANGIIFTMEHKETTFKKMIEKKLKYFDWNPEIEKEEYHEILALYKLLKNIQAVVMDDKDDDSIFRSDWKDEDNNLGQIFNSLLTEEERALVLFIDEELKLEDFNNF